LKYILLFTLAVLISACKNQEDKTKVLLTRIDSLEKQIREGYKPGFGEFMSGVQVHHAKLWFAGQNQNWKLADFEINEMIEALSGIKKFCADRAETKNIDMIDPPIDSINLAIKQKSTSRFKNSYFLLTNTCNRCHQITSHEFNVIKIPESPPFNNQDYKVQMQK
jgi:hypothetical protein